MEKEIFKDKVENAPVPYNVRFHGFRQKDFGDIKSLSFVIDKSKYDIYVGQCSHEILVFNYQLDSSDCDGGVIWPSENKISFYCNTLGTITDENQQKSIASALENDLGIKLLTLNN